MRAENDSGKDRKKIKIRRTVVEVQSLIPVEWGWQTLTSHNPLSSPRTSGVSSTDHLTTSGMPFAAFYLPFINIINKRKKLINRKSAKQTLHSPTEVLPRRIFQEVVLFFLFSSQGSKRMNNF